MDVQIFVGRPARFSGRPFWKKAKLGVQQFAFDVHLFFKKQKDGCPILVDVQKRTPKKSLDDQPKKMDIQKMDTQQK